MKIIFLDIDGVLNYQGSPFISEDCLIQLKRICRETKARLVLISTWRVCLENERFRDNEYTQILKRVFSAENNLELYKKAPNYDENRSLEVKIFLEENKDIESFVIIDDSNYEYSINYPQNWVRPCYFNFGLTEEKANTVIEILGKE